jgi:hypothetical protein
MPTTNVPGVVTVTSESGSANTPVGKAYNYTLVVTVPLPFQNLKINTDLVGSFVLPAFTTLKVPKALLSLLTEAKTIFENVIADAARLIMAIPEATVTILVVVGNVTILNVQLVAQKTPVAITPPEFVLGLPNVAVDLGLAISLPFPVSPVVVYVPIPVPIVKPVPLITLSGGKVVVNDTSTVVPGPAAIVGGAAAAATPGVAGITPLVVEPPSTISSPILLPTI